MIDFVGVAKWKEWNRLKGMSKASAISKYVSLAIQADPSIKQRMAASFNNEEY